MNLLAVNDASMVAKTSLSRKLTIGGVTKAYPVYRVRLDLLFYNDQNDRIATWITQYQSDPSNPAFASLDTEAYNNIIQGFIIESNPAALEKTKNNIALVNQREPGVVLSDGRIIDGNRRFTCLRLLHAEDAAFDTFETVILDAEGENTPKQIKMLELSIQHGEEQRVGYNLIDLTVGAYHDIVETKLLTVAEYAESTNETVSEVRKRLEIAELVNEFLAYIGVPKQYHIAREMQVYSLFFEAISLLKRCDTDHERQAVKYSVFDNAVTGAVIDQKKFIRSLKSMQESGTHYGYLKQQEALHADVEAALADAALGSAADVEQFAKQHQDLAEDLAAAMDRSVSRMKLKQSRGKPSQLVTKSISALTEIDLGVIDILSETEREQLTTQIRKLDRKVSQLAEEFGETPQKAVVSEKKVSAPQRIQLAASHPEEPIVCCTDEGKTLTSLNFGLSFSAVRYREEQQETVSALVYFVNDKFEQICPVQELTLTEGTQVRASFSLNSGASALETCYLIVKSARDSFHEAQRMIPFAVRIAFNMDFDF